MVDLPVEVILAVLLLVQVWLVWRVWKRVFAWPGGVRRWAALAALALYSALVLGGFSFNLGIVRKHGRVPYWLHQNWREYTILWLGCSAAAAGLWIVTERVALRRRRPREIDPGRRALLRTAQTALAAAPFAVVGYGTFIERRNVRTVEVDLPVRGLPRDLEGLRIVQISDIHLSPTMSISDLAWIVDAANETRPHIAAVTGDLVTKFRDPVDECVRQLSRLRADAGVYGSLGNHETYAKVEKRVVDYSRQLGMEFLRYERRALRFGGSTLNLVGVDYEPVGTRDRYLMKADGLVDEEAVNVLLSHNPDVIPAAVRKGFDVTLAGHTHGGQVTFEILHPWANIARYFTPYVYGKYELTEGERFGSAFVTRGAGTIIVPVRLGAPPEIALIRLRGAAVQS